ncbi:MAG: methylated-DNA--[protein]-cysteine S-methyltransferase [Candidatus Electrothrix sp. GW3-4]|uniref:methylated-DNA--[protein]-cysteine S-methyltransferase n=1 Tax=Candidatus Electrothrix sp. GW3-4 TaxID=3126740 RepID=UPI0030D13DC7
MISTSTVLTPLGQLALFADDHALFSICFPGTRKRQRPPARLAGDDHPLLCQAKAQLEEYFQGKRKTFDLLLCPQGTAFQQAVWTIIEQIPFGQTRTYGEIATLLGNNNKARAVGGAANKNPLPIVIPCHRVIGSSGSLTGFAGGLTIKRYLLNLEQRVAGQQ